MPVGVCSSHVATIMSRTSPRPFQVLGLPSASIQLVSPVNSMAPIPFQVVKESATTPTSGSRANTAKNSSAGRTKRR